MHICNSAVFHLSFLAENRRTGHRRILWSHVWNLKELWVRLHPLLPVQRLKVERAFHSKHRGKCFVPSLWGSVDHKYTTTWCFNCPHSSNSYPCFYALSAAAQPWKFPCTHRLTLHVFPALPHPIHSGWTLLLLQGQWDDIEWKLCKDCFKDEGCTDVGCLYVWRSSFCLCYWVNGYLTIHMIWYWPHVSPPHTVILGWDLLRDGRVFDRGCKGRWVGGECPTEGAHWVVYFYSVQNGICINITRRYYWKMLELEKMY